MTSRRQKLIEELKEPAFRRGFVEGHAKDGISTQIRLMRKASGWDQKELAQRAFGDPSLQSMVSRYENPDYGKYSLSTLLEIAAAFDVGLVVRFTPFSQLIDWDLNLPEATMTPKNFTQELAEGFETQKDKVVAFNQTAPLPAIAMKANSLACYPVTSGSTASGMESGGKAGLDIFEKYFKHIVGKSTEYGQIKSGKTTITRDTIRDNTSRHVYL